MSVQEPRQKNREEVEEKEKEEFRSLVRETADSMAVVNYLEPAPKAGHGHAPTKHDIRSAFGVTEEVIAEVFENGVIPNGHEAVHYLYKGREEFIEADADVFEDTRDNDSSRWKEIEHTMQMAPIPPHREARIRSYFD